MQNAWSKLHNFPFYYPFQIAAQKKNLKKYHYILANLVSLAVSETMEALMQYASSIA